jgi:hypothetical protein
MPSVNLGPLEASPLLYALVVVVIAAIGAYAMHSGRRDRKANPEGPFPPETRWFFDGPLVQALQLMRDTVESMRRIEGGQILQREHLMRGLNHLDAFADEVAKLSAAVDLQTRTLRSIDDKLEQLTSQKGRRR